MIARRLFPKRAVLAPGVVVAVALLISACGGATGKKTEDPKITIHDMPDGVRCYVLDETLGNQSMACVK